MVLGNAKLYNAFALDLYNKVTEMSKDKVLNDWNLTDGRFEDILSYAAILFRADNYEYYARYIPDRFVLLTEPEEVPKYLPKNVRDLVKNVLAPIYCQMLVGTDAQHKFYPWSKEFGKNEFGKNADKIDAQDCMQYLLFYARLAMRYGDQKFFADWRNGTVYAVVKRLMQLSYFSEEKKEEKHISTLERYKGCLFGGAAGDALGYPVEFRTESEIVKRYGKEGIKTLAEAGAPAVISDDTQMSLFAGNAFLYAVSNRVTYGVSNENWNGRSDYGIWDGYREWLGTQGDTRFVDRDGSKMWIYDDKRLHALRAPGNTCLSAIRNSEMGGTVTEPVNNSKGCGSVMRAGVVGLSTPCDGYDFLMSAVRRGREDAALTHGHPLGIEPSGWLSATISNIVNFGKPGDRIENYFVRGIMINDDRCPYPTKEHLELIETAVTLAYDKNVPDIDAIHMLGEGWVAEEALAIAVFCAVRYQDDFAKAIRVAVNHKGDSDSTGSVCGNLLGAWLGEKAVAEAFDLSNLDLRDVIETIAEDLYTAVCETIPKPGDNKTWDAKYRR